MAACGWDGIGYLVVDSYWIRADRDVRVESDLEFLGVYLSSFSTVLVARDRKETGGVEDGFAEGRWTVPHRAVVHAYLPDVYACPRGSYEIVPNPPWMIKGGHLIEVGL